LYYFGSVEERKDSEGSGNCVPKFGVGSSSCAGNENRTAAISATPINLVVSEARNQ
jgi:hypothetical protein